MKFEELQKIWDTQTQQPMYVINESALYKHIQRKRSHLIWSTHINEIGLMCISAIASIILVILGKGTIFTYLTVAALLLIAGFILFNRIRRKVNARQYDRNILGDLDHALEILDYQIKASRHFLWWYILPVAIPAILNMVQAGDKPLWQWIYVLGSFVVGYLIVRWALRRKQIPKRRELLALRTKLLEELEPGPG